MRVYVMSAGASPEHDYRWTKDGQSAEPSPLSRYPDLEAVVDQQAPSVAIARSDGRLVLFITGLQTGSTDYQNRPIRNSLFIVGGDEPLLRDLAATALEGGLAGKVEEHIGLGGPLGFSPDMQWFEELSARSVQDEDAPKSKNQVAATTEELRGDLARQLREYRLPRRDGILVLSTRNVSTETMAREEVWRGLSNLVQHDDWRELKSDPPKKKVRSSQNGLSITSVILLVVAVLVMAALVLMLRPCSEDPARQDPGTVVDGG